ncbi:DUF2752 domain-containing protein [Rubrobacter tropicus]|uniref:DUF2752 domain-containing protein n=1 Tax=Rubrobacter tropicus TaxID=2653851 RepID=A0A6G8QF26_9ACTN|nr:DUF2752 domain-containing protein [Rubrobacter tropicus]
MAFTGCYCPGCASLRALHQITRGHLATASGSIPCRPYRCRLWGNTSLPTLHLPFGDGLLGLSTSRRRSSGLCRESLSSTGPRGMCPSTRSCCSPPDPTELSEVSGGLRGVTIRVSPGSQRVYIGARPVTGRGRKGREIGRGLGIMVVVLVVVLLIVLGLPFIVG